MTREAASEWCRTAPFALSGELRLGIVHVQTAATCSLGRVARGVRRLHYRRRRIEAVVELHDANAHGQADLLAAEYKARFGERGEDMLGEASPGAGTGRGQHHGKLVAANARHESSGAGVLA